MKIEYKDKITGEIWVKDCTELGCKNIGSCEDACLGFLPEREYIEVISIEYGFGTPADRNTICFDELKEPIQEGEEPANYADDPGR